MSLSNKKLIRTTLGDKILAGRDICNDDCAVVLACDVKQFIKELK